MISCNSLPDHCCEVVDEFVAPEIDWPVIVQGIAVYAQKHPPKVASELLEWARSAQPEPQKKGR